MCENNNCLVCVNCNCSTPSLPKVTCKSAMCLQAQAELSRSCSGRKECENDCCNLVYTLSDAMEERCQEVGESIGNLGDQLNDLADDLLKEIKRSTDEDNELEDSLDDLKDKESHDFNRVEYISRDSSNDHLAYIEFYHDEEYLDKISAEPFLKDGILQSVDLESDGHTLHFVWNTDAGEKESHVDLDRLVLPISDELATEKTERTNADNTINTTITNLKNSITAYNPELKYDKQPVTVGLIDGKQFLVHLAEFPELVSGLSLNNNNQLVVTTNKGNASTIQLKDENDRAIYDGNGDIIADTYETKAHAANTYETKAEAADHVTGGSFNTQNRTLTLTRENAESVVITIPDADTDNYLTGASVSGHTLSLTRSGDLGPITVQLPDDDYNYYVTGGSVSGNTLTLTRNGGLSDVTIQLPTDNNTYVTSATVLNNTLTLTRNDGDTVSVTLPDYSNTYESKADANNHFNSATFDNTTRELTLTRQSGLNPVTLTIPDADSDTNTYVTSASISSNVLTLTRNDGLTITVTLPAQTVNTDDYVVSGSVTGNVLTLTRNSGDTVTINLPANVDNDHYVTSGTVENNVLKLTRQGIAGTVDVNLPNYTDNDHYPTSGTVSNDILTISGNTGFAPFTVDLSSVSGVTNVTYEGNSVTLQQAINAIVDRIESLEALWYLDSSTNRVTTVNGRGAVAGGFYDSTVS